MQPLKITFHLRRPVVEHNDRPLHLDALLAAGQARQLELAGHEEAWTAALDLSEILDREDGIWKASWLFAQTDSRRDRIVEQHVLVRRPALADGYFEAFDAGRFTPEGRGPVRLNSSSGPYKGFMLAMQVRHVLSYTAWAVGDLQAMVRTLAVIKHIGKVRRNGYGEIARTEIEPAPDSEAQHWRLRTLPEGMRPLEGMPYALTEATVTAPYWQRTNRVPAIEPIGILS